MGWTRSIIVLAASCVVAACGDRRPPEPAEALKPAGPASSQAVPAWESLDTLVGKLPSESGLFETSVIAPDLKALLGDRFETFKTSMQTESPLQKDGVLYTSGNKTHDGGVNQAYLLIDPATKRLEVGLWTNRQLQIFATPGATPLPKPKDVTTMIENAKASAL